MKTTGKRFAALLLAAVMLATTVFCTEVPVSAASIKNEKISVKIEASSTAALKIGWKPSSMAQGYVIYRRESVKKPFQRLKTVSKGTTSYLDRNLPSGKSYQYAVRAYRRENGKNVYSAYTTAISSTRPPAPASIRAKAVSDKRVNVSWDSVSRADGYRVYKRVAGKNWTLVADIKNDRKSLADMKVSQDTQYIYSIRSYRLSGGVKYTSNLVQSKAVTTGTGSSDDSGNHSKYNSAQKEVMKKILYAVETGGQVYGRQDYADFTEAYTNSSAEHAITIGAGQWYANEARRLLLLIHDTMSAKEYAKYDPKNYVWNDVKNKTDWSNYRLVKESGRAKIIVKLISSPTGIKCQDQLMYQQIGEMEAEIRKLGVTEARAVGMFINIRHQGGLGAVTRVLKKTKRPVILDNIYKALQSDTGNQVGAYKSRQKFVYEALKTYMK